VESRRACRAVLVQHANGEQAIVLACTSFVVFILLHKQILFVSSNEINYINVYFNKLVKNLHIITLYKLHNKLSCESRLSRSSCRVCRAVLFDKLDTAKMHGLDTSYVSSRDEKSGILASVTRIMHVVNQSIAGIAQSYLTIDRDAMKQKDIRRKPGTTYQQK